MPPLSLIASWITIHIGSCRKIYNDKNAIILDKGSANHYGNTNIRELLIDLTNLDILSRNFFANNIGTISIKLVFEITLALQSENNNKEQIEEVHGQYKHHAR